VKIKNQKSKIKNTNQNSKILNFTLPFCILIFAFCILFSGCEAFVRKFTRKPKKAEVKEEIVSIPQDYSQSDIPVEERYRQYFVFWKSWQDELIASLSPSGSYKKRKGCLEEAIENLQNLRPLLFEEKQKDLDVYLEELQHLKDEISQDIYGTNLASLRSKAESLKRNILRDFSYLKVSEDINYGAGHK